jgi:hypothetical protein
MDWIGNLEENFLVIEESMTGIRKGPGHGFVSYGSHERDLLHTSILYYLRYLISQHINLKSEYIQSG